MKRHPIVNRRKAAPWGALLCLFGAACAHTHALPQELVDARAAYNLAAQNAGAELAQAQLQQAQAALHQAEQAYVEAPEARTTRDLAYIAQRRAQLADSVGGKELARAQRMRAETTAREERQRLLVEAQNNARLREQVIKEQAAAVEALSRLSRLKSGVRQDSRGVVVTLGNEDLFTGTRISLTPQGKKQLDDLARVLRGTESQYITVESYTDGSGPSLANEALSQQRAQSVSDYLASCGIPEERLQAIGRGASSPVAPNRHAEGRAANRRVEIIVQGQASAAR